MSLEVILEKVKGTLHFLYLSFVLVPYYTLEAIIVALFGEKKIPKSVKEEIVLITGTGHGIGKLLAIKYASEGATVVAWDVNEKLNNETVDHIKSLGYKNVYGYTVDIANRENVLETAKQVQDAVGDVTILINNAGIMPCHSFLQHTEAEIRRIMDINVMGNFWTIQAFLPAMAKNNHGHIVAVSSMAGLVGVNNVVPYSASKFALRGMMEGLREEFRRIPNNKICFTTVYPFIVNTGLVKNYEVTYPSLTKILKPEFVAEEIFKGQTNNTPTIILPKDLSFMLFFINTFWPKKAVHYFADNLKSDLLSDLQTKKDN